LTVQAKWIYSENKPIPPELLEVTGSEILARLLLNRGIDSAQKAKDFLNPAEIKFSSPYVFQDMKKCVERIHKAVDNNEHIVIYGDFDCDGVTSTSLLYKTLKHIGADVSYYVPDRKEEGHGLNSGAVCKLISGRKAKVIITVDCGISNLVEIQLAKTFGADVIITDHHEAPEVMPQAFGILNPKAPNALLEDLSLSEIESLTYLAGVGVAYKFAEALLENFNKPEFKDEILHLVAIGSIADVVPILGENRGLVQKGLGLILQKKPEGVLKLLEAAGCDIEKGINAETIAFAIAPRINATGRLEHADTAVKLLTENDSEEIMMCTKKLEYCNRQRQQMCETTFMEAEQKILRDPDFQKNKAIILADPNWHTGIIGIVASKLVEKYYRPVFLISIDKEKNEARCSARSIEGLHLYETLCLHSDILKHFGGHASAAGFSLDLDVVKLEDFVNALHKTVNDLLDASMLQPRLYIDAKITTQDFTVDFVKRIQALEPFGEGNPSPIFSMSELTLREYKTMGQAQNHMKLFFADKENVLIEGVWWNKSTLDINHLEQVSVAFSPRINSFAGKVCVQMEMKDIFRPDSLSGHAVESDSNDIDSSSIKWIDHRKKTGFEKALSNYLKTAKNKVTIFAENQDILARIKNYPEICSRIVNRQEIEQTDQIMFFEFPPDEKTLKDILEKSNPRVVHLMPFSIPENNQLTLIKTVSGMLKYAYTNRDGLVDPEEIALRLSTSKKAVELCIELLNKTGVIEIINITSEIIEFKFVKSNDISALMGCEEYHAIDHELQLIEKFRHELLHDEISRIQNRFLIKTKQEILV